MFSLSLCILLGCLKVIGQLVEEPIPAPHVDGCIVMSNSLSYYQGNDSISIQGDWTNSIWRVSAIILEDTNNVKVSFSNKMTHETMFLQKGESSNGIAVMRTPRLNGRFTIVFNGDIGGQ